MKKVVLLGLFFSMAVSVIAQRNCATTEIEQLNKSPEQLERQRASFEKWLLEKRAQPNQQNALQDFPGTTVYKIPVVVHIIHNGEAYGEGLNITDEQIASQIAVLNKDFRHLNADSINTPSIFQSLMADVGFEFELAKRDPYGLPTDGITRTNGNKTVWYFNDNTELKSLSYWSSTDYLNIWVTHIDGYYGWAEYPTSDLIDGVNSEAVNNPLTDGVVIESRTFGSVEFFPQGDYVPKFDLGRITTHEIGHFFGLRHIWGDGGCDVDDFVDDTPKTSSSYISFSSCPPDGTQMFSCNSEPTMFMNYMEYVNDNCLNMFSLGQKSRMVTIINNSPRRASLLTSNALIPPPPLDAAIAAIPTPAIGVCNNLITPTVTIVNAGEEQLTQLEVNIIINSIDLGLHIFPLALNAGRDTTLTFNNYSLTQYGNQEIKVSIGKVNGRVDDSQINDSFTKEIFYSEQVTTLNEEFTTWPESWAVRTEAPISNWNYQQAPNLIVGNKAAVLNYYQNSSPFEDQLITPILDLSTYNTPYFLFDHAYGQRQKSNDKLRVLVSTDCGNTFSDTLFIKSGDALATTTIPARFTPSGSIDWQTNVLNLQDYINQPIQLAFVGNSEGGNNIYLDNFRLVDDTYEDVNLVGLTNESATYSSGLSSLGIIVENSGTNTLNTIEIEASENNSVLGTQVFNNLNLAPGEQQELDFDNVFSDGLQNIKFKLVLNDAILSNNEIITSSNFIKSSVFIPFRDRFNATNWNNTGDWTITSPYDEQKWVIGSSFMKYEAFSKGNSGLHDWLVLPMFDLRQNNLASIQFDLAYASNDQNNELLRVWVSTNGGRSFDNLLKTFTADQMATANSNEAWFPTTADDWHTQFIDLSDFTGEDNVLVAFESIDGDGNNIYLDNIELFITNEQNNVEIETNTMAVYPNPISNLDAKITFNLDVKQNVAVRILDIHGNLISDQTFNDVLNQTFPIELATNRNGIYIIQTVGADFSDVTRILVNR